MTSKYCAAITGFAEMAPEKKPGRHTPLSIIADLAKSAAADAGLEKKDIDGLIVGTCLSQHSIYWSLAVADYLHLNTSFLNQYPMPTGMVGRAIAAIEAGLCNNVLCVVGDTWDSKSLIERGLPPMPYIGDEFDAPYGLAGAPAGYALIAQRHMYEYGTKPEQLAKISVDQRHSACSNPAALFGNKEITINEVLDSRMISTPIHLLEAVSPCTGGGAFIVSRGDIARSSPNNPVYLLGSGEAGNRWSISQAQSLTTSLVKPAAEQAFRRAGISPQQIDFVQAYDCFTIVVLITLEDAGFCNKGEGGQFVEDHNLSFDGDFPCNTHGGQLSFGQPGNGGGMSQLLEGVRQLMGRAGKRQLDNPSLGYINNNGGIMSKQCSLILGLE